MSAVICNSPLRQLVAVPRSSAPDGSDFKCAPVFKTIEETLSKDGAKYVKKVNGVFCFKVKDGPDGQSGQWIVDVKNGNGSVRFDPKGKGDVTIAMSDENLLKLMLRKMNPEQAFFQGKLKITGNMGLAMKLKHIQPTNKAKL